MGAKHSVYHGAPPPRRREVMNGNGHSNGHHATPEELWRKIASQVPNRDRTRKVAVVGSGVTGLGAAYHLVTSGADVEVVVYEPSGEAGGHAHTEVVDGVACDTGFMVFNHQNYPNMVELFQQLGIEDEDTCMSFGISMDNGTVEWSSENVKTLRGGVYVQMIKDMLRFNKSAAKILRLQEGDPKREASLGEYLKSEGYSPAFINYYIVPMCAALWSSSAADVLGSSAYSMVAFMDNHCMLQIFDRPQWKTVAGRSRVYVERIVEVLGDRLRLNTGVAKVSVQADGKKLVTDSKGHSEAYDEVLFACHSDQALSMLDGEAHERAAPLLGRFAFSENDIYLHSDPRLMPKSRAAWASWNYIGTTEGVDGASAKPVFVTYWLNKLQNLKTDKEIFVSLNPTTLPAPALTHKKLKMGHPQFTPATTEAQEDMISIQGVDGLWYAGAWMGHGFHEDGLRAGLQCATAVSGKKAAWMAPEDSRAVIPMSKAHLNANRTIIRRVQDSFGALASIAIKTFLSSSIKHGLLVFRLPGGGKMYFGDMSAKPEDRVVVVIKSWWFFVRVALEYDLGLARAYMAGEFEIERTGANSDGLTKLFMMFIKNRDRGSMGVSHLLTSWIGYGLNFLRYRMSMDNSITGSRSNISAHYDIGNDLYNLFLDKTTMMYSSAVYDLQLVPQPSGGYKAVYQGSLEEAQIRKIDTLIKAARVERNHKLLDIGFGWGGVAIRAAETVGCRVVGITLSKEQKALAEEKVKAKGLQHLISFELIDYRVFAKRYPGEFDRIISCEMIEAVGHDHLGEYFAAVNRLLKYDGIFVMEAITTPESRYAEYLRSTDFINTIVFPGSCCPSLTALMDAMARHSELSLEGLINIDVHYAETLREWRRRFNGNLEVVKKQGFDDVFIRCWNYYLCYCEAAFESKTEGCLILTFSRPGNLSLLDNTPCTIAKKITL